MALVAVRSGDLVAERDGWRCRRATEARAGIPAADVQALLSSGPPGAARPGVPDVHPATRAELLRRGPERGAPIDGRCPSSPPVRRGGAAGVAQGIPFAISQGVYRRFIRVATSASGRRFVVFVARDVDPTRARPERCRAELQRRFERLLRGRPAGFRRFAVRIGRRLLHSERRRQARGPQEGVFLFDLSVFEDRAGGGAEARARVRSGATGSSRRPPSGEPLGVRVSTG